MKPYTNYYLTNNTAFKILNEDLKNNITYTIFDIMCHCCKKITKNIRNFS